MGEENRLRELLKQVENKFLVEDNKLFEPYIKKIRFPKYKALRTNTEINFTYPLTVLVGINGSNKTSVLQALYGAPGNQSIGNYWFSTEVDKIKKDERHAVIYSYYHEGAKRIVEVLKTRIEKEKNPDYWEPSRPLQKYNMERIIPEELITAGNRGKTRWDNISKNVVFCDFKDYISAFDMYFYNYLFEPKKTFKTRQDFIRLRSKKLSDVITHNLDSLNYTRVEQIEDNFVISPEICKVIGEILDQDYEEIRIISHKLYSKGNHIRPLKTILIKKSDFNYSEAFAGSGESRLIMLVNDIMNAPEKSLILIDEPEINLHPRAIIQFKYFLLNQILRKGHQIVLTTHSHYLVDKLPNSAIKLFQNIDDEVTITENVDYTDAFLELGEDIGKKAKIIVEDKLAKAIVEYSINKSGVKSMEEIIEVQYLLGGVDDIIINHIRMSSTQENNNTFYILDGDTNLLSTYSGHVIKSNWIENDKINPELIPESEDRNLENIIKELTNTAVKFTTSSGTNKHKELAALQRKFLEFWKTNVFFLNSTTPERAIIESMDITKEELKDIDTTGKEYFEQLAQEKLGREVNSNEILIFQEQELNKLSNDSYLKKHIKKTINQIWQSVDK